MADIFIFIALSCSAVSSGFDPPTKDAKSDAIERGDRHFEAREYAKAVAAYTEAIDAGDDVIGPLAKRAKAYLYERKVNLAIADANRILSIDEQDAEAFHLRAAGNRILGKYKDAVRDMDKAISLRPTAVSLNLRGTAHLQLRDYDAAIRDYSEAIRIDPKRRDSYISRASVHRQQRDFDKAIADLSAAIRLEPEDPFAYELRSKAYAATGRDEEAEADRQRAAMLRTDK